RDFHVTGVQTCALPIYDNVDRDIALYFAEWGFDLIKVDACGIRGLTPDSRWVASGQVRSLGPWVDSESIGRTDIAKVRSLYDEEIGRASCRERGEEPGA